MKEEIYHTSNSRGCLNLNMGGGLGRLPVRRYQLPQQDRHLAVGTSKPLGRSSLKQQPMDPYAWDVNTKIKPPFSLNPNEACIEHLQKPGFGCPFRIPYRNPLHTQAPTEALCRNRNPFKYQIPFYRSPHYIRSLEGILAMSPLMYNFWRTLKQPEPNPVKEPFIGTF